MSTEQAAVWLGPDRIEVQERPGAELPEGWASVAVAYNGICGTDLAILHGSHPRARPGVVLGHELSGRVVDPGTTGLAPGTLVVAEPLISCGRCRACRSGASHVCRHLGLFGIDAPGGLATRVVMPGSVLHEVPDGVDPQLAALAEPLAVAVHAVDLSGMEAGDTVAVLGAGPIGLLTALVARHAGAARVVVSEPGGWRRSVAAGLGFEVLEPGADVAVALAGLTGGEGADTTFDTAAHPDVAAVLSAATRVLGRIVVVGVYKAPTPVELREVSFKEQVLRGVRVYTRADVQRAIALIASGELGLERLPVTVYGLDRVAEAFAAAASGADCLKVMVAPTPREPR